MRTLFPAIVDRAEDGTYGVVFPDVEGCSSGGDTLEEAVKNAEEALAQHLDVMNENGLAMPAPSELAQIAAEKPDDSAALILVEARVPERVVRINITIDPALLERIDAESKNRSAWLANAAREKLARARIAGEMEMIAGGAIPVYPTKVVDRKTGAFTIDTESLSSYVIVGEFSGGTVEGFETYVVPGHRAGQKMIIKADPYPTRPAITYRIAASGRYVEKGPTRSSGRDKRHSAGSALSQTSKPVKKK